MTSTNQSSNAARLKPVMQVDTRWRNVSAALAWFPNRRELAVAGSAAIWLISIDQTGTQLRILRGHESDIASIAFSLDGNYLASGGADTHIQIWDMETNSPLLILRGHTDFVSSVAFSPDGIHIASAGRDDTTVRIWNRRLSSQESILKHSDTESVLCAVYNYDGKIIASGGQDGVLYLWDAGKASLLTTLEGHSACITSIAFHPHEKILASADFDGAIILWNIDTYKQRGLLHHMEGIRSISFNSNGTVLATGGLLDGNINLWDVSSYLNVANLSPSSRGALNVAFSADGAMLASSSEEGLVQLWTVQE